MSLSSPQPQYDQNKTFNGKIYKYFGYFFSSNDANWRKTSLKKQGYLVRVIYHKPKAGMGKGMGMGGYWIYARKK